MFLSIVTWLGANWPYLGIAVLLISLVMFGLFGPRVDKECITEAEVKNFLDNLETRSDIHPKEQLEWMRQWLGEASFEPAAHARLQEEIQSLERSLNTL